MRNPKYFFIHLPNCNHFFQVCNHPDLFELRPTVSPLVIDEIKYKVPSLVCQALDYDPFSHIDLESWNFCLLSLELTMSAFQSHRTGQLKVKKSLIQELDSKNIDLTESGTKTSTAASSLFLPLSNASEGTPVTSLAQSEENRNFFDAIKESLSGSNTPRDSEASDSECVDEEKSELEEGPPVKKSKIDETESEVKKVRKYGKRILDDFLAEEKDSVYSSVCRNLYVDVLAKFDIIVYS